ncbi:MAG: hypothetical protein P4L39_06445 [Humidesulfovibrio sp.]|nr:hypothetical protein [Humidesulfovibrio sp.]
MKAFPGKPGLFGFVFAVLLLVFNWPVLSIPAPGSLFAWLFIFWGLGIALLLLVALGISRGEGRPRKRTREDEDV